MKKEFIIRTVTSGKEGYREQFIELTKEPIVAQFKKLIKKDFKGPLYRVNKKLYPKEEDELKVEGSISYNGGIITIYKKEAIIDGWPKSYKYSVEKRDLNDIMQRTVDYPPEITVIVHNCKVDAIYSTTNKVKVDVIDTSTMDEQELITVDNIIDDLNTDMEHFRIYHKNNDK